MSLSIQRQFALSQPTDDGLCGQVKKRAAKIPAFHIQAEDERVPVTGSCLIQKATAMPTMGAFRLLALVAPSYCASPKGKMLPSEPANQ